MYLALNHPQLAPMMEEPFKEPPISLPIEDQFHKRSHNLEQEEDEEDDFFEDMEDLNLGMKFQQGGGAGNLQVVANHGIIHENPTMNNLAEVEPDIAQHNVELELQMEVDEQIGGEPDGGGGS